MSNGWNRQFYQGKLFVFAAWTKSFMLITNALAIVWLLNKQVGVLSLISELLNCSAEIWTIQNDTACDSYL